MIHKIKEAFSKLNSVQWKLVFIYISLILISMQLIGVYFFRELERYYINEEFKNNLYFQANLLSESEALKEFILKPPTSQDAEQEEINDLIDDLFVLGQGTSSEGGASLQVLNQEGIILGATSTSQKEEIVGQRNIRANNAINGQEEASIRINSYGNRVQVYTMPIKEEGRIIGAVYIEASLEEVYDTILRINRILVNITIFTVLLTALLGFILARTITNPVKEITNQAAAMASGDFERRVKVKSVDEIGRLGIAFNDLAAHLREALTQKEEEKRKLASVLSNMSDGVLAADANGYLIVWNQRAEEILQRSLRLGDSFFNTLALPGFTSLPLLEHKETLLELEREGEDHPLIIKVTLTPIRRPNQEEAGFIAVLQDVTEEERLDQQRKEFVANVSHELRTPLTTIISYLEALQDGALDDPELARRFTGVAHQEGERMTRLISDLLQLSRLDAKKIRLQRQPMYIKNHLEAVADRFAVPLQQKQITFRLSFAKNLPKVYIDSDRVNQVLDNLLSNAVKYTPEGESIHLSAYRRADGAVQISIQDTGIGIPQSDLKRIFERFYRVDKARSRSMGGTGLGLSIAQEIIHAHEGDIWIESVEGEGTTVTFTLPSCEAEVRT
ncbi:cell wall metabolism sensor histidine kinase WalK [Mechercharimyces sp. CAU 1602]|uniref:cell wall metabolism sensor histidine kinase WalK n=1 Tax=Mechercharimyces sp. CAU 1602 TaxID=2973933 RepID=UPI00216221B6|nr:cell wall metabolism sensor histidine kinase WalK [Mechercharimyces sp. CAU 1602]MCS1352659.1 cell wall metabolism sensor histidine kinase WalK [Mechercharimyces sp. CAU 1602]